MTNAEARSNNSLRPRKPEGSLGRTAQDVHLDSHTAPELVFCRGTVSYSLSYGGCIEKVHKITKTVQHSEFCNFKQTALHSNPITGRCLPLPTNFR